MDGLRLADRLAYGAGCAARRIGFVHDVYRAIGAGNPLDISNRFMQISVALLLPGGSASGPAALAQPFRQAVVDWSYLRTGDYLVGPEGILFVAQIEPPKPTLVILTNEIITIVRPGRPKKLGMSVYSGTPVDSEIQLIEKYPSSFLVGGMGNKINNGLPDDIKTPGFSVLLPILEGVKPQVSDILVDQNGMRFITTSVEEISGVWRLSAVQAVR